MSKYKNKKCIVNGISFDSFAEGRRYAYLSMLEREGKIRNLKTQVVYELIPAQRAPSTDVYKRGKRKGERKPGYVLESSVRYIADFVYEQDGKTVVEDVKGKRTKDYVIKRKLMLYVHNVRIREVTA